MASYCDRCGRGTWACGCDAPFSERVRTIQIRHGATNAEAQFEIVSQEPAPDPLDGLRHDERYPVIATLRDRMVSVGGYPKPPPMPERTRGLGW